MAPRHEGFRQTLFSAMILFFWVAAFSVVSQKLQNESKKYVDNAAAAAPLSYISPEHIDPIILGRKDLYDDFLNLWLLQFLADPPSIQTGDRLMEAIRSVIRHQPKIESLYLSSCIVMFSDHKAPEKCQEIVLAGLKVLPQSWKLPMLQGYVHGFLLDQSGLAASFFDHAAALPSSPPYVKSLASRLARKEGITIEEARKNLERLLWEDPDSGMQRFIKR